MLRTVNGAFGARVSGTGSWTLCDRSGTDIVVVRGRVDPRICPRSSPPAVRAAQSCLGASGHTEQFAERSSSSAEAIAAASKLSSSSEAPSHPSWTRWH